MCTAPRTIRTRAIRDAVAAVTSGIRRAHGISPLRKAAPLELDPWSADLTDRHHDTHRAADRGAVAARVRRGDETLVPAALAAAILAARSACLASERAVAAAWSAWARASAAAGSLGLRPPELASRLGLLACRLGLLLDLGGGGRLLGLDHRQRRLQAGEPSTRGGELAGRVNELALANCCTEGPGNARDLWS